MKKTTLPYLFGFAFCLISLSVFSQDNENVIILEMPTQQAQTTPTNDEVVPAEKVTATTVDTSSETDTPIYIADGVVIKNLNLLDPATILSVDVADNMIIITTTNAKKQTPDSEPVLASNI